MQATPTPSAAEVVTSKAQAWKGTFRQLASNQPEAQTRFGQLLLNKYSLLTTKYWFSAYAPPMPPGSR
jgi:hypothetical protein